MGAHTHSFQKGITNKHNMESSVKVAKHSPTVFRTINKLIFGIGNYQWPNSRESVGIRALESLRSGVGWRWNRVNSLHTDFAQKADIALAKPLSYEALHSHRAFLRVQKQFNMAPQDVLIVYPDMNLEPGEINFSAGGKGDELFLAPFQEILGSDDFQRVAIGIGKQGLRSDIILPTALNTNNGLLLKQYLANCFPEEVEAMMAERTIPSVVDILRENAGITL